MNGFCFKSPSAMPIFLLLLAIFKNADVSGHINCYVCGASRAKLNPTSLYDYDHSYYGDYPAEAANFSELPTYPDEFDTAEGNVIYHKNRKYERQFHLRKGGECEKFSRPEACLRGSSNCITLLFPEETQLKPLLSCGNRKIECDRIVERFQGPPTCTACNTNLCNAIDTITTSAVPLPSSSIYVCLFSLFIISIIKIDPS